MNDDELRRPSTWLAALGLGLIVAGVLFLADQQAGTLRYWLAYPVAGAVAFGSVLLSWHGGLGAVAFVLMVLAAIRDYRAASAPLPPEDEPEPEVEATATDAIDDTYITAERTRTRLRIFFAEGQKAGGFSFGKLRGVVGSDTHERLTKHYRDLGVLEDKGGNVGHVWGYHWTLERLLRVLPELPLPPGAVPEVTPTPSDGAARSRTARKSRAQDDEPGPASRAVVEGVVSGERA